MASADFYPLRPLLPKDGLNEAL